MTILWFVYTTGKCNLKCTYCGGSFPESLVPSKPKYSIDKLKRLIKPQDNIAFYGGEPLLNYEYIEEVLERIPARKYIIQTNATLIEHVPERIWHKVHVVLVSIDGVEEITDKHRGRGVYRKVISAVKYLREKVKFRGEIIARMTVTEDTDIYRDVTHLLKLRLFDKIHWQLNVVWCERWDFERWCLEKYLPGLKQLIKLFTDCLSRGIVFKIVPFTGILTAMLFREFNHVPCGAGHRSFTVCTDGRILACPIAVREKWAQVGDIERGVVKIVPLTEPCTSCLYLKYCGGRCLYAHYERYWGWNGFRMVCFATQRLIDMLWKVKFFVEKYLELGIVRKEELFQDGVEDSTEIIP